MPSLILRIAGLLGISFILSGSVLFFFTPIRNVPIIVILLVALVIASLFIYIIKSFDIVKQFTKPKKISLVIFGTLFSFFVAVSIKGEHPFLLDNHILTILIVWLGVAATIFIVTLAVILLFLSFELEQKEKIVPLWKIAVYALPFFTLSLFFLFAFYPGLMTPDSLAQWGQAKSKEYTNWHPVVHTWILGLLLKIRDTPAIIAFAQILMFSFFTGFLGYVLERSRIPQKFVWTGLIIFALSPVHLITSITLWKDVWYSAALFFFTILMFLITKSAGKIQRNWPFLILFILVSFGVVFFRHNGFPVFIVTMILVLIMYRKYWIKIYPIVAGIILIHQIITGPIYDKMNVHPSDPQEMLSIPTQQIATIVTENGVMTKEQESYVNEIFPIPLWHEKFHPYSVDSIKFSWGEYDRWVIYNDYKLYAKMYWNLVKQNPGLAAKGLFRQTSLVWQINEPPDGYTSRYVTNIYLNNEYGLENHIFNNDITQLARNYLVITDKAKDIIWRPAFYTVLALLFTYISYLRNNWRAWLLILPVALNTGSVFVGIPAQDFRYLLSNSLVMYALLFFSFVKFDVMEKKVPK